MIQRLNHTHADVAEKIYGVFQKSYAVEAKLLEAVDFPPLQRTQNDIQTGENDFYGFYMDARLVAVVEIAHQKPAVHIQSLVVLPEYFRMGIASSLISFVSVTYPTPLFTVETGFKNEPAIALYKKFDFVETKQWNTDHGIRKIRFEKRL
ncbi:GNAT family N-acetyltransferase [Aggregatimonas sangjinii]|uniref:GNAT family N-acetyltransferase n=1 Tax=Aggregatimonas sangjinii TaxID=2583587 RepID=A0A5B7SU32_9FLAO|nr:GNAT family N-acetyltransferase [Aggregatimonas sangjinii]QCX00528.1 GNAT family N-acetyltransferase [Aggregatimonas sangjinii]